MTEWWERGIKHFDDLDEEAFDLACHMAWEKGHLEVWEVPGEVRALGLRRYTPYAGYDADQFFTVRGFLICRERGLIERWERDEPFDGDYAGMWYATTACEKWMYFLYRSGGAKPWEEYRKKWYAKVEAPSAVSGSPTE